MHRIYKRIHNAMIVFTLATAIAGCTSDQLPVGASLQITPSDRSIQVVELRDENDVCIYFDDNYVDLPVVITLVDRQQSPIGGADVSVYLDFTENTFTGIPVLKLYRDGNGNGVIDGESEYVSGIDDPVVSVRTRDLSGNSNLLIRVNLSCAFRGEVFAFIDSATASATISVEANSPTPSSGG